MSTKTEEADMYDISSMSAAEGMHTAEAESLAARFWFSEKD